jgi:hypothetical protein
VEPFTDEEIDKTIKEMASERVSGPDGFTKNVGILLK